jgi:hypothetical protein
MSKSLEAVFFPHKFNAFPQVSDKHECDRQWKVNRPWIVVNMAHAAYCNNPRISKLRATRGGNGTFF